MPKEEWGVKRLCPQTGKRFYDMNRSPIISPYTGEIVEIDTGRKSTVGVTSKAAKPKVAEVTEADDDAVLEDDDTDDVDLGDDVLEDDDDDDTVALDDLADVAADDDDS
jgi:uncharacterized protein (TIGR02300 family)